MRRNTYVGGERGATDHGSVPLQNGSDGRYRPHLLQALRSNQGPFPLTSPYAVRGAPVLPPRPHRGQWAEPPHTASAVQRLRVSGCASLEGRRVAAPFMVVSFEKDAPPPTTAPPPHPACHMTRQPSPSHGLEVPSTCSPNSPPDSPAGRWSCCPGRAAPRWTSCLSCLCLWWGGGHPLTS